MKHLVVCVFDGMADWQYAHITAQTAMAGHFRPAGEEKVGLLFAAESTAPVTSMGGMGVRPDVSFPGLETYARQGQLAGVVFPGGSGIHRIIGSLSALARALTADTIVVAAICTATIALASAGLVDTRAHTSNRRELLDRTGYAGADFYREERVVFDRRVITASGTNPVPFSAAVLQHTGIYPPTVARAWEQSFLDPSPRADDIFGNALNDWAATGRRR
ncbi:DJ-1/PfpI family protein [Corynebacterium mendelii]|uniref:DJ-1/PfpI family protein n=1 Tax=Corynebacterium mendelii TaxID=2765362 RepID=A0A939IXS6_9CORY|nr:DJ-1/PfpI family protein [Corynebacterium mendelii]MBN9644780.1 DJ-1/PfpI family protein [Corynebacterium mendelii]